MAVRPIRIGIRTKRKFTYSDPRLVVHRGDTVKWKLKNNFPFAIFMKTLATPFTWKIKVARKGKWITGRIRENAAYRRYRYGAGAYNGRTLLVGDPEIIVRPPDGGRKG